MIALGAMPTLRNEELARTPGHISPGRFGTARHVSTAGRWLVQRDPPHHAFPSSMPQLWLPSFEAPLTFPSAFDDFGRVCRTSPARRRQPSDGPRRSHVNDVIPSNDGTFANHLNIEA